MVVSASTIGGKQGLDPNRLLFINMGLGQDSTAIGVLYCEGKMPAWIYTMNVYFVFVDTGCEMPPTYTWAREHLIPYLAKHGHELHWLEPGSKYHRTGPSPNYPEGRLLQDLRSTYMADKHPSFPMLGSGGRCTATHKQGVLARFRDAKRIEWCGRNAQQQTAAGYKDVVIVGIAADETHRALPSPAKNYEIYYPLIELGLDRAACREVIAAAGLEVPQKSGCSLCPFSPVWQHWWLMHRFPEEFAKNEEMENLCNADRVARGAKPVYMAHRMGLPLRQAAEEWHRQNPHVTLEDVERWFIEREVCSVHWGKKKRNENQLFFDFEDDKAASKSA